ncbi:MAG: restriction endonuclease subunit S [Methylococcaceae bacterium]
MVFLYTSRAQKLGNFSYNNKATKIELKNTVINLPTKNGKIDFDFMESFIAELEAKHMAKLEAYLLATGLKDYTLTAEEQQVLDDFENGIIKFSEFRIGELFEINSYKKRFDANKVVISEVGKPYVVRTSLNNGIRGYINEDEQFLNEGNTISFGQDTATMFYQETPYFTGDKIKIVKSKDNRLNKLNALFFISTMTRTFSSFSWGGSSFNVKIIANQLMKLPTQNHQLNYAIMETFISAIQKLVIKDVVLYADKKIAAHNEVIGTK